MVISPQLGQLNFVALVLGDIVRLQLVQIGVWIDVAVLIVVFIAFFLSRRGFV